MSMNCLMSFRVRLVTRTSLHLSKASPFFLKFLSVQPANIFLSELENSQLFHLMALAKNIYCLQFYSHLALRGNLNSSLS
ncbi:AABR07060591.1 [Phodopus roborovskii]|uniref:AABR07060591.1 protein n=1 Tax=Phodopus roborovskii TaxID=109678 RepID=A0AAV0A170_PHORO|nr:AABR07060591.1 [Phodopus roborovskii]